MMRNLPIVLLLLLLTLLFFSSFHGERLSRVFPQFAGLTKHEVFIKGIEVLKFFLFLVFFYLITFWKGFEFSRVFRFAILFFIVLIFACHSLYFSPFTVDDAFISFQYAKNLATGNGLTFNEGERVEGYTNFLLVIIESLLIFWGVDLLVGVKLLSILAGTLIILLVYRLICFELREDSPLHLLPCLILALNSSFVLSSTTGLETQLFTLAVFSGLYVHFKFKTSAGSIFSSLLLTLSVLIRPEGVIVFAVITVCRLIYDDDLRPGLRFWFWILTFLALFIPYFSWRCFYFGELLPNTFYAKVGGDLISRAIEGKRYVRSFLKTYGLMILSFIPLVQFFRGRLSSSGKTALFIILTYFLYIGYVGKDWIPLYRFVAPVIPIICFLLYTSAVGLFKDLNYDFGFSNAKMWKYAVPLLLAYFVSGTISFANTSKMYEHTMMRAAGYEYAHKGFACWLNENTDEGAVVAMMDVGMVKFYTGRYFIDITGLTDKFIARSYGGLLDKDYDLDYIFDKHPDYIVLVTSKDFDDYPFESLRTIDTKIYHHPYFKKNYRYLFSFDHFYKSRDNDKGYFLNVFKRIE